MKKLFLLFLLLVSFYCIKAQISQAQKDSALNQLYFKSASFQFNIDFKAFEYVGSDYTNSVTDKMTDEEVLATLNRGYQDAEAYIALCYRFIAKKDMKTASEYFDKAIETLKSWANAKPNEVKPVLMMLDLCSGTQSFQAFDVIAEEALQLYPKHIAVLSRVFIHALGNQQNLERAEKLLNQALAEDPYSLVNVSNWVFLQQFRYIITLKNNPNAALADIDISLAQKAFKKNPKSLGYEHLYQYARVTQVYMNVMRKFFLKNEDNFKGVLKEVSKAQKKQLQEADAFFRKNIGKATKSKNTMRKTAAFVNVFLNKNNDAIRFFEEAYAEENSKNILESIALTYFIDENWASLEATLAKILEKEPNDMQILLSYMSLYEKYKKNEVKLKETAQRVEQTTTSDPIRSLILATWYLKQKNLQKADFYCDLLSENSKEELLCQSVLAILKDDKTKALQLTEKMLALNKDDKEALHLKKILEK
jgi:predicted Zn-dependent protease